MTLLPPIPTRCLSGSRWAWPGPVGVLGPAACTRQSRRGLSGAFLLALGSDWVVGAQPGCLTQPGPCLTQPGPCLTQPGPCLTQPGTGQACSAWPPARGTAVTTGLTAPVHVASGTSGTEDNIERPMTYGERVLDEATMLGEPLPGDSYFASAAVGNHRLLTMSGWLAPSRATSDWAASRRAGNHTAQRPAHTHQNRHLQDRDR